MEIEKFFAMNMILQLSELEILEKYWNFINKEGWVCISSASTCTEDKLFCTSVVKCLLIIWTSIKQHNVGFFCACVDRICYSTIAGSSCSSTWPQILDPGKSQPKSFPFSLHQSQNNLMDLQKEQHIPFCVRKCMLDLCMILQFWDIPPKCTLLIWGMVLANPLSTNLFNDSQFLESKLDSEFKFNIETNHAFSTMKIVEIVL